MSIPSSIPVSRDDVRHSSCLNELYQAGYQQALDDFAIAPLLQCLHTFSDHSFDTDGMVLTTHEAEAIAAQLIQAIASSLSGSLIASYCQAMRYHMPDGLNFIANLLKPPTTPFPEDFPNVETPKFLYGDRLGWISTDDTTDWGVVIGRFYGFATHCCRWCWGYLIWLDPESPSAAWINSDTAWEDDLQPFDMESAL